VVEFEWLCDEADAGNSGVGVDGAHHNHRYRVAGGTKPTHEPETVQVRHVHIGQDQIEGLAHRRLERDEAVLSVRDIGPGIDPARRETIFDRFVQGAPSERAGTCGLGLGLYIAREIVRAHGGTIGVDSAPDTEATVTIRLTVRPEDTA
jgi:signal transduction histidine kinase